MGLPILGNRPAQLVSSLAAIGMLDETFKMGHLSQLHLSCNRPRSFTATQYLNHLTEYVLHYMLEATAGNSSPKRYGLYSAMKAGGAFINHNDAADKHSLDKSFSTAEVLFRERFGPEYLVCVDLSSLSKS